jgi:hypothetical protein
MSGLVEGITGSLLWSKDASVSDLIIAEITQKSIDIDDQKVLTFGYGCAIIEGRDK